MNKNRRYVYDPLYGIIYLPELIWDVITCPEIQRLREVRLCNINSLCLTGAANINRYEHAIGTYYLAKECLNSWPPLKQISENEKDTFSLAALLHDITSGAFGHSVEYIESKEGFEHEKSFKYVTFGEKVDTYNYKSSTVEPIYFSMSRELLNKISIENINIIDTFVSGKGRFGPLINSVMDLDNIDNVYRLAYHIGIVNSGKNPLELARSLYTEGDKLIIKQDSLHLVEEWHNLRKKLYEILLLNPEEFSAKCMLTRAIEIAKIKENNPFKWNDVDFELLLKLCEIDPVKLPVKKHLFDLHTKYKSELNKLTLTKELQEEFNQNGIHISLPTSIIEIMKDGWMIKHKTIEYFINEEIGKLSVYKMGLRGFEISKNIFRLMKGDLYGCVGIFSTSKVEKYELFTDVSKKREFEDNLSQLIRDKLPSGFKSALMALHPIKDINKTERQICIHTDQNQIVKIGNSSNQLLIGVFFENVDLNMYYINNISEKKKNKNLEKNMKKIRLEVFTYLSNILGDQNIREIELYGEINE